MACVEWLTKGRKGRKYWKRRAAKLRRLAERRDPENAPSTVFVGTIKILQLPPSSSLSLSLLQVYVLHETSATAQPAELIGSQILNSGQQTNLHVTVLAAQIVDRDSFSFCRVV